MVMRPNPAEESKDAKEDGGGGGGEEQGQGDQDGSTELKDRLNAVGHAPLPLGHPLLFSTVINLTMLNYH